MKKLFVSLALVGFVTAPVWAANSVNQLISSFSSHKELSQVQSDSKVTPMLGKPSAGVKIITLTIAGMTCSACPITVKKALTKVDGVIKVEVSFEKREASITFNPAKTTIEDLIKATTDVGYPSTVKK